MSVITNMLICCSIGESSIGLLDATAPALVAINKWCEAHELAEGQFFVPIDMEQAGGHKTYCDCVWACSGNYFPWKEFASEFASFPWVHPDQAVLIIQYEHNDDVVVVRACAGKRKYVPGEP